MGEIRKYFWLIALLHLGLAGLARGELEWGVMSGSFDPPTNAHLQMIRDAVTKNKVGKIYVLVNISGVKDFKASYTEREAMLKLGLGDLGSRVEILPVRQESKDSVTIPSLKARHQGKPYFAFIGTDSFAALPTDLSEDPLRTWVIHPRAQSDPSSTEVRRAFFEGRPAPHLTPEIMSYALNQGLYLSPPPSLWEAQVGLFETARRDLYAKLQQNFPGLELDHLGKFTFEPQQSRRAWADKLLLRIESASVAPEVLDFARDQLLNPRGEPKYQYLSEIRTLFAVAKPTTRPLPELVMKALRQSRSPVFISKGASSEAYAIHEADGFTQLFQLEGANGQSAVLAYHPEGKTFRVLLLEPKEGFGAEVLTSIKGLPTYTKGAETTPQPFHCMTGFRLLRTFPR